ncbi:MAG: ATP-binding protein [Pseudomonadota bacterium]
MSSDSFIQDAKELVDNPREALSIELKTWLDLNTPDGKSKFLKAVFALRNNDGGYLVIGVNDASRIADPRPNNLNIDEMYNSDTLQKLVTEHAVDPFEIEVFMVDADSGQVPVIRVTGGLKSPSLVKKRNQQLRKSFAQKGWGVC